MKNYECVDDNAALKSAGVYFAAVAEKQALQSKIFEAVKPLLCLSI